LDANVPRTIDRAIAQAQIVLELLVHAILVDGGHKAAAEVSPIGRGIARLLEHFGISIKIPSHFKELVAQASREGWKSGPWAITELRNEVIHPKRGATERPTSVKIEAWKLAAWYVEMTLLAMFGFDGEYGNRLNWPRWTGQVERVPWAQPSTGQ
jgi:hypothetical protein